MAASRDVRLEASGVLAKTLCGHISFPVIKSGKAAGADIRNIDARFA